MGAIKDGFESTFRPFVTDGVPASGANRPSKAEASQLGTTIEIQVAAAAAAVSGDGIEAILAAVQPIVDDAEAAAALADAAADVAADAAAALSEQLAGQSVLSYAVGSNSTPGPGSEIAAGTYVFAAPMAAAGTLGRLRAWGGASGGTVTLKRFTRSGNVFTHTGDDLAVNLVAGANSSAIIFPYNAGDLIGFYVTAGAITYVGEPGDSGGYYDVAGNNTTSFTDASATSLFRLQIGFDLISTVITGDSFQEVKSTVDALGPALQGARSTEVIGRVGSPADGLDISTDTFVFADAIQHDGTITTVRVFGGSAGGQVIIRVFDLVGSRLAQSGADVVVTTTAGTLSALPVDIAVLAGQYVGFRGATGSLTYVGVPSDGIGFWTGAGNVKAFQHGAATTVLQLQIGFDIRYFDADTFASRIPNIDAGIVALFGDSITQTEDVDSGQYAYGSGTRANWPDFVIPTLDTPAAYNYARAGASFASYPEVLDTQKFAKQIDAALAGGYTADTVVVAMGINDYGHGGSLGSYDAAMAKSVGSLDLTIPIEAARAGFYRLQQAWPDAVKFCCIPLQNARDDMGAVITWADLIARMAGRYGFEVVDCFRESGIVADFEVPNGNGRDLEDGLHPKPSGQLKQGRLIGSRIRERVAQ